MNPNNIISDPIGDNQDKYSSEFEEICILKYNTSSKYCTNEQLKQVQIDYNRMYL